MHTGTNKGQISDLGKDLVACTVGLWRTFKAVPYKNQTRDELLEQFSASARLIFGKGTI